VTIWKERGVEEKKDCNQTGSFGFQFRLESIFQLKMSSILLPGNWVSCLSLNVWRDSVSKWTHWLNKEGDNLERSMYCVCWGSYPQLSGEGSHLIKKVSLMKRLPWRMSTIEH